MQQTSSPIRDNVTGKETQTKKCHVCHLDKYLGDFVYLNKFDIAIESIICVSCRQELDQEKRITKRLLRKYSLV